jgi:hypothetical protein
MSVTIAKLDKTLFLGKKIDVPVMGGWVAGGAIRRWFGSDENLSDVDMFFNSEASFENYRKEYLGKATLLHETPNALTYDYNEMRLQLIRVKWFVTLEELLDSFDFTVCQFAWDGNNFFATPEALVSVLRKHLGVHKIQKDFAVDSLRRAFKYAKKGFYPCNGSLQQMALSLRELSVEEVNKAVEISPNGGKVIVRID